MPEWRPLSRILAAVVFATVMTACTSLDLVVSSSSSGVDTPRSTVVSSSPSHDSTPREPTGSPVSPYPPGLSEGTIRVGRVDRRFLVHLPDALERPRAVVLVLHGGGGRGIDIAREGSSPLAVFRSVADREGFVVVYPEGLAKNDLNGNEGWVDCRSDDQLSSGVDDVAFLAQLIERLRAEFGLPTSAIFMVGSSNGAMMTQAFAFQRPDLVGGVAASAGNLPQRPKTGACRRGPSRPVPILLAHGTADSQMPYRGGCVADLGGDCRRGRVISAEATRDRWLKINGASRSKPVETVIDVTSGDAGDAHCFEYRGSAPVVWWRLDGAGHSSPSRLVLIDRNRLSGTQNRDIEFAEIVWDFFERRLPRG